MLRAAARRNIGASIPTEEEGPFVSFTDLFVGILFFFLILIAALMIMQRTSVQMARSEAAHDAKGVALAQAVSQANAQVDALNTKNTQMEKNAAAQDARVAALVEAMDQANAQNDALNLKNKELQNKLNSTPNDAAQKAAGAAESARRELEKAHAADTARISALQAQVAALTAKADERDKLDREHPPFRLALAFNVFGSKGPNDTDRRAQVYYWATNRIFRNPGDQCIYNPITDFENHEWQKHDTNDVLTPNEIGLVKADKCYVTADRVYYMTKEGGYDLKRVSPDLYAGTATVIAAGGTRETHYVEYRILGIYDDAFKWPHQ
jgi:cell wall-associated NlpC family hydrolase